MEDNETNRKVIKTLVGVGAAYIGWQCLKSWAYSYNRKVEEQKLKTDYESYDVYVDGVYTRYVKPMPGGNLERALKDLVEGRTEMDKQFGQVDPPEES